MRPGTPGFVGPCLREAREARGLTAVSLADLLGVTTQAVSQYEKGLHSPSPDVLNRICEVLNLPPHFFLSEPPPTDGGAIFYRSMGSATKAARTRAERRYGWTRRIVAFVRRYITFPKVQFPDFAFPNDPAEIRPQDIEEAAAKTRRHWGLGDGPISNVAWLLENNGAVLSRQELGAAGLDAFSQWGELEGTPYVILGSDKSSGPRSRYDAAHECGHMILHRNFKRRLAPNDRLHRLMEQQAHSFAGEFLLPAASFSLDCHRPTLDLFRALKPKWKLSIQFMLKRTSDLGYLSDEESRRLWINLSRRGWRKREPLDDSQDHEMPRFLRRSFELLVEKRIIARDEIPFQVRLAAGDIETLSNLPKGYFSEPACEVDPEPILKFPMGRAQG